MLYTNMQTFQQITTEEVKTKLNQSNILLVDIRDQTSYQRGHIPNAQHLSNKNLADFLQQTEKNIALIVYCYHGISSQSAANFLLGEGFTEVYSMMGGFEMWKQHYPNEIEIN